MTRRSRRREKDESEISDAGSEPRSPVVVIHCPQCGGNVRDAELGTTTRCDYCGTELHLPEIGPAREDPPAPAPAPVIVPEAVPPAASPNTSGAVVVAVVVLAVTAGVMMYIVSRGEESSRPAPAPTPTRDPKMDATLKAARCFDECTRGCDLAGPNGPECMNACDAKCGFTTTTPR